MSKNISEIPFTEIVERVQKLGRVGIDNYGKIRGVCNDIYMRDIPAKFDWTFLMASSAIQTVDEYHAGNVTMTTGDTAAIFSSDASFTSVVVGRRIKFGNNPAVYEVTGFNNTTSLTIAPSYQGTTNLSGASYSIYKSVYPLASNFDRFPKPGGIYRWAGGSKQILPEDSYARYVDNDFAGTATTPQKTRLCGTDTMGCQLVELIPPPRQAANYGVDYFKTPSPLYETTAGTISSIAAGATTIFGSNTKFTEAGTDGTFWFRVDNMGTCQDSTWYRVVSITHDSQMTIATTYANSAVTAGASYTIAKAPEMPVRMHEGLLWGALRCLTQDQNDPNSQIYNNQYAQVLSDAKRIYVSRPYSQDVTGVFEDFRYRR